jgi:hypothetical protein
VAVALAIALPVVILESRRMPDWQAALIDYLDTSGVLLTDIQAVWTAEARTPDRFPVEELVAVPTEWAWQSVNAIPPPQQVRCIRLQWRGRSRSAVQLSDAHLVIGYHDDGLYRAGWIVHEFRSNTNQGERQELFVRMGCTRWKRVTIGTR